MDKGIPAGLIEAIDRYQFFLIAGHKDPDGDCVGSQLAFSSFLKRQNKKTKLLSPGPFTRPEIRTWEPLFHKTITEEDRSRPEAALVVIDCSSPDRIGPLANQAEGLPTLVIDHHSSGSDFGDHRYIDSSSPSASLLVQSVIESMGETPSLDEAQYLFFGFATDTGFFRHLSQEHGDSLQQVGRLLKQGASPRQAHSALNSGRTLASRKLLARIIDRCESAFFGQFLFSYELAADREELQVRDRDSDRLFDLLLNIEQCEAVCVVREEEAGKQYSASFRSREWLDVGEIAGKLGGGGHSRAAGSSVPGSSIQEIRDPIFSLIEQELSKELF